jgi:hypothetical protein
MSNFVAVERLNTVLDNVTEVFQFFYKDRLITIVGEHHKYSSVYYDKLPYLNIVKCEDYCYNELSKNVNCNIFLEFHKSNDHPDHLESSLLKNIYLKCFPKFKERIIPSDFRLDILVNPNFQGDIYNHPNFSSLSIQQIVANYVETFITNKDNFFSFLPNEEKKEEIDKKYDMNVYNILKNEKDFLIKEMELMKNILSKITEKENDPINKKIMFKKLKETNHQKLKDIYQKSSDLKTISIILEKNTHINEFIVVIGTAHSVYINKIIKLICSKTDKNNYVILSPAVNSLSLYESYLFNENQYSHNTL